MAKDVGTAIHKFKVAVVVSFLPCLVTFLGFHPTWFFIFFKCFFVTCFCWLFGEKLSLQTCCHKSCHGLAKDSMINSVVRFIFFEANRQQQTTAESSTVFTEHILNGSSVFFSRQIATHNYTTAHLIVEY